MKNKQLALLFLLFSLFSFCKQNKPTQNLSLEALWNQSISHLKQNHFDSAYTNLISLRYQVQDSIWLSEIYTNLGYIEWIHKKDPYHSLQSFKNALLLNPYNEIARKNLEIILRQLPPPPPPPPDLPPTFMQLPSENSGYTFFDTSTTLTDSAYEKLLIETKNLPLFIQNLKKHLGNPYQTDNPPH